MPDTSDGAESIEALQGLKFLERLQPLLERLHEHGCERDQADNRKLHYDHLCGLILLTFFNPVLTTLRDLREASKLAKVRETLDASQTSTGSLSEAMQVFDPELLVEIIQELLAEIPDSPTADPRLKELAHVPTAVDGTLLLRLPQITQACFNTRTDLGWKMHTHFEVLRGVPIVARVTDASGKGEASEKAVLRKTLEADRCYITDRGYEQFSLFNDIVAADSSYVCRIRNDHQLKTVSETRELSDEAKAAGVLEDVVGRMGKSKRATPSDHDQRRIVVKLVEHPKRGGRRRQAGEKDLVLVTSLLDVPVEIIVLLYRFRWLIELFFRWLKCVLGCRHLLSKSENGIQIQMYCAMIACLLLQLAVGGDLKPKQWTYKILCLFAQGWATEEEVLAHFQELRAAAEKKSR